MTYTEEKRQLLTTAFLLENRLKYADVLLDPTLLLLCWGFFISE
jgi:hypothetical protein